MDKKHERNSSIELLRIIAMIGVIVLHYNHADGGGVFKYVNGGSIEEKYAFFSESLFICAVNLYVMISSYFLSVTEKRKFIKIVELIGQVVLFQVSFYFINLVSSNTPPSFNGIIKSLLPANYFVVLYLTVYILSPYINIMIKNLSKKNFTRLVMLLFFLFSVWTFFTDFLNNIFGTIEGLNTVGLHGDQYGYTIVNFLMIYCIGAYVRITEINMTKKQSLTGIFLCVTLIFLEKIVATAFYGDSLAWKYNNPLVVLLPVFIILLFTKIEINSRIINELAKSAFTCYLIHGRFLKKLGVENVVNRNVVFLILHQLGSAMILYLLSYIIYKIYSFLTNPIIKWLKPKCERLNIFDEQ